MQNKKRFSARLRRDKSANMYYVYILVCSDKRTYIGCTADLKERIKRHTEGKVDVTCKRLPVYLKTYIALDDKYTAFSFEKYLKSGSGRAFIKKHQFVNIL